MHYLSSPSQVTLLGNRGFGPYCIHMMVLFFEPQTRTHHMVRLAIWQGYLNEGGKYIFLECNFRYFCMALLAWGGRY